jgi:hypothetical protein
VPTPKLLLAGLIILGVSTVGTAAPTATVQVCVATFPETPISTVAEYVVVKLAPVVPWIMMFWPGSIGRVVDPEAGMVVKAPPPIEAFTLVSDAPAASVT